MASESNKGTDPRQGVRRRAWNAKVRTGCKTCKRRKVKCDEGKPACRCCIRLKIECEGYAPLPKPWIFSPSTEHENAEKSRLGESLPHTIPSASSDNSLSASDQSPSTTDPLFEDATKPATCKSCIALGYDCECPATPSDLIPLDADVKPDKSLILRTLLEPSGSYRTASEQYYLKYFLEVIASAMSRTGISSSFWNIAFPQAAWTVPAAKDTLLSSAITYRHVQDCAFSGKSSIDLNPYGASYQNRAIRALIFEPPPLEAILIASQGFWLTSILYGDWARSLQHSYYVLKLCAGILDRRKRDLLVFKYSETLVRCCLDNFRTTRGPCLTHPTALGNQRADLLDCDASCYIPEEVPFELRIADALFHLRPVASALSDCRAALLSRHLRHSHHERIIDLLETSLVEAQMLEAGWSNFEDLGLDRKEMYAAQSKVPYTHSPFAALLRDLSDFIEKDKESKFSFGEVELRMRVTMPNLGVSVARDNPHVMATLFMKPMGTASPEAGTVRRRQYPTFHV